MGKPQPSSGCTRPYSSASPASNRSPHLSALNAHTPRLSTYFIVVQVVEPFKGEILLLAFLHHFLGQLLELAHMDCHLQGHRREAETAPTRSCSPRWVPRAARGRPAAEHPCKPMLKQETPRRCCHLHPFVDHLAEVEGLVGELSPATVQDDLEDGSHQPPCRLGGHSELSWGPTPPPSHPHPLL